MVRPTAVLSWHAQNVVVICIPAIELQLDEISIEFELWWKSRYIISEIGPWQNKEPRFKRHFLNVFSWNLFSYSLKFRWSSSRWIQLTISHHCLGQLMPWCGIGDKPLSGPMMTMCWHGLVYASLNHTWLMTSSNGNIFRVTGPLHALCGEFAGDRWIPRAKAIDAELWCFPMCILQGNKTYLFDLCLNKRLSKQSWGWWFETPSRPLWRHRTTDKGHKFEFVTDQKNGHFVQAPMGLKHWKQKTCQLTLPPLTTNWRSFFSENKHRGHTSATLIGVTARLHRTHFQKAFLRMNYLNQSVLVLLGVFLTICLGQRWIRTCLDNGLAPNRDSFY